MNLKLFIVFNFYNESYMYSSFAEISSICAISSLLLTVHFSYSDWMYSIFVLRVFFFFRFPQDLNVGQVSAANMWSSLSIDLREALAGEFWFQFYSFLWRRFYIILGRFFNVIFAYLFNVFSLYYTAFFICLNFLFSLSTYKKLYIFLQLFFLIK